MKYPIAYTKIGTEILSSMTVLIGKLSRTVAAAATRARRCTVAALMPTSPKVEKYASSAIEVIKPPRNMAKLPGQDLFGFHGRGQFFPNVLPMISAKPSPPHIIDTMATAFTDSLHSIAVTNVNVMV